jgi:hypothetical protein
MENLRSTFPLNEALITRRVLGKILTDPISWVPLVPAVAGYTIFDLSAPISLGFGAVVLGAIGAYWRKHWPELTEKLRAQMVRDHNRAQDTLLKAAVQEFYRTKEDVLAQKLDSFVLVKQQIERRLHETSALTPQKIQLEQLVDSICFGARDQLESLRSESGKAQRTAVLKQVDDAFQTLQAAMAEIDSMVGPTALRNGIGQTSLEEVTRSLKEEMEIARRVQARLRILEETDRSTPLPRAESQ